MICWRDTTYCASPDCINECGRKMSEEVKKEADKSTLPVAYAYFCGVPEVKDNV